MPVSRIQDILHDKRKKYFLDMQDDIDIRNTKMQIMDEINNISSVQYAQMS